jgi:hypothetical protein
VLGLGGGGQWCGVDCTLSPALRPCSPHTPTSSQHTSSPPQDEDRLKTAQNEAPNLESFNRVLARNSDEYELFQRLDTEAEWPGELMAPEEVRGCVGLGGLLCFRAVGVLVGGGL